MMRADLVHHGSLRSLQIYNPIRIAISFFGSHNPWVLPGHAARSSNVPQISLTEQQWLKRVDDARARTEAFRCECTYADGKSCAIRQGRS
jgi:hypothetical protein